MLPSIKFPAVAISPAGWHKTAADFADLTDASPVDDLAEWQRLEVFDSEGKRFLVRRAYRAWPKHGWGAALCRLFNQSIHVGFEFESIEQLSTERVAQCVSSIESLPSAHHWSSPREIMEFVCS
jgi:hypothetical protein